ncbi:MAG: hypothetical protein QW733_00445 [Desulfurococcaceae archaeon]
MKQKALVYSGRVEVVEYPVVPVHENILVKPMYVYIGDLERGIVNGVVPLAKPTILGSVGIVKVIEVFDGPTEYTGKVYSVTPLGDKGILGVDIHGLLSSYASLTSSYLDEELIQYTPFDSLKPLVKHVSEVASLCEEPVLIEGCGLIGVATGLMLRKIGVEPVFYCEEGLRRALMFDFQVYKHTGSLSSRWRTLVLTSTNAFSKYTLLSTTEVHHVIVTPLSLTRWIPIPSGRKGSIKVTFLWKSSNYNAEHVKSVLRELEKVIKVIDVQDVEKTIGLIPPRGLGTVISLKS